MELFQAKLCGFAVTVLAEQAHDLEFTSDISHLLCGIARRPRGFARCRFVIEPARVHEIIYRLIECPPAGMKVHIDSDARGAIPRQPENLTLGRRTRRVEAAPQQHLFGIERPAFDENSILMMPANFILQVICDGDLQKMAGYALVPENRPGFLDSGTDVEVLAIG